ncbi:rna-directed dna polymerase from mobile element jockey-like [Willisornis vidua]|uniref:Rna-directed dna polymerase from mobile element jockey-like n=1 Tax=Willisornis vidua TaxID=1566151 RepID=A0ABQ9CLE7_9PASS|nr:rna-directed dna polymerase from mobile element jockey-like [Willisornis vidua]
MEERRAVDIVCLDFIKAFDTVPHNILIGRLRKYGLDEWTVRWIENWLNSRSQRVVSSGTGFSWRPVTCSVPRLHYLQLGSKHLDRLGADLQESSSVEDLGHLVDNMLSMYEH